jgi:predicted nucleotidyltransferase
MATFSLFRSELQVRLLGLVMLGGQETWTVAQLAERLDATQVSVHRELHRALDSGLVVREAVGRTHLYRAAQDSPLYEPVRTLLERTVGIELQLRRALEDLPGVQAAFIHGSFAGKTKIRPTSDVDVLVLGEADPHALRRRVRRVEREVGREIDLLAYRPDEFAELVQKGNSLARRVISGPVTPLVGSPDDLVVK